MIRAARDDDAPAIAALEKDCFGTGAWSETLVAAEIGAAHTHVVLDDLDGTLRGYGSIAVAGDVADLSRIAVHPSARRDGIARRLLADLVSRAGPTGADRVLLEVADGNDGAIALYERAGFATISRRRRYYADGSDALVMQLDLS